MQSLAGSTTAVVTLFLACSVLLVRPCLAQNSLEGDSPAPRMNLQQARDYMLSLINRDRAAHGVAPVQMDTEATKAGQWHSDEMAKKLFNGHWHPDGTKPQRRYTLCGGMDYDAENSHGCLPNSQFTTEVAADQSFTASEIEKEEACYFDEVPPRDGHRKNILDPGRTHVGIGLTLITLTAGDTQYRQIISSQEFVNKFGRYRISAGEMKPNVPFSFGGVLQPGYAVHSVSVSWEKAPAPISLDELRATTGPYSYSYSGPSKPLLTVFPLSYAQLPNAHLQANGNKFLCEIIPERSWKPGLYYVLFWVKPENNDPVPASQIVVPLPKD